jgi:phosphopantothenoylcysteine decarboxylase/phosphopantothenate--cysteine ligase
MSQQESKRSRLKVLVTGGGTREPIDGVRFITNFSTGDTAARLVDSFVECGDEVTYLCAEGAARPRGVCEILPFTTFKSLDAVLKEILTERRFDVVVHLAAVSDYYVESIVLDAAGPNEDAKSGIRLDPASVAKLDSAGGVTLHLKRNFKILDRIKSYAVQGQPVVVGFKLTNLPDASGDERAVAAIKLSANPEVDLVVHNDMSGLADREGRLFTFYRDRHAVGSCRGPKQLAECLRNLAVEIRL